jgi:hypothetical protein
MCFFGCTLVANIVVYNRSRPRVRSTCRIRGDFTVQPYDSISCKPLIIICVLFALMVGGCGEDGTSPPPQETVCAPSTIDGPDSTECMKSEYYCCSGASCSEGHDVEHQFSWGNGDSTAWLPSSCASHEWASTGSYAVKARARCTVHNDIVSDWCGAHNVTVVAPAETVSTPNGPSGSMSTALGQMEIYCTGGSTSNMGHLVQYHFDWGDGFFSSWSAAECASHTWADRGSYTVRAQARCATHMHIVSPWSDEIEVSVLEETISPPNPPSGPAVNCPDEWKSYSTGGAASSLGHVLEYRFDWGDGTISSWSVNTAAMHSWTSLGYFDVHAQARCATHTSIESDWSGTVTVRAAETVTEPGRPNGPASTSDGHTETYCTNVSATSCGHYTHRQWKINTEELPWTSSTCERITFPTAGTYNIRVRSRCARHPDAVSGWSISLKVTVQ